MKLLSEEIKEKVIEARNSGKTFREIADEIGVPASTANNICIAAGLRVKAKNEKGRTCPKCKRGGFPAEYIFCPFCTTDMRSEKELCIERLERAKKMIPTPHDEKASQINFAIIKAIEYLKHN